MTGKPRPERKLYPPLKALTAWRESKGHTLSVAAAELGISKTEMYRWESGRRRIPAERVQAIEDKTKVPRQLLRPDVFKELKAVG